jgi:hypothetical protein
VGWRGGRLGEVCVSAVCVGDVGAHASFFFPGIMIQGFRQEGFDYVHE